MQRDELAPHFVWRVVYEADCVVAADFRLQQLVNRIVKGEEQQALNEMEKDSTANYINF